MHPGNHLTLVGFQPVLLAAGVSVRSVVAAEVSGRVGGARPARWIYQSQMRPFHSSVSTSRLPIQKRHLSTTLPVITTVQVPGKQLTTA